MISSTGIAGILENGKPAVSIRWMFLSDRLSVGYSSRLNQPFTQHFLLKFSIKYFLGLIIGQLQQIMI
jgi:hypothetical protein